MTGNKFLTLSAFVVSAALMSSCAASNRFGGMNSANQSASNGRTGQFFGNTNAMSEGQLHAEGSRQEARERVVASEARSAHDQLGVLEHDTDARRRESRHEFMTGREQNAGIRDDVGTLSDTVSGIKGVVNMFK